MTHQSSSKADLTWLVKQLIQLLAPFLATLFNRSIVKKSSLDPAVLGNYRPMSNLPFISKVLERAVMEWKDVGSSADERSHTETSILIRPRLPYWRWRQTPCSLLIRASYIEHFWACSISALWTVWITTSSWIGLRNRSISSGWQSVGFGPTSLAGDNTFDTMYRCQP